MTVIEVIDYIKCFLLPTPNCYLSHPLDYSLQLVPILIANLSVCFNKLFYFSYYADKNSEMLIQTRQFISCGQYIVIVLPYFYRYLGKSIAPPIDFV